MPPRIILWFSIISFFATASSLYYFGNQETLNQKTTLASPASQTNQQEFCASDYFLEEALQDPRIKAKHEALDQQVRDLVYGGQAKNTQNKGGSPPVYRVPVVVHIIHNNGPENISDAQVQTAIDHMNDAYRNVGYYNPATGVDTEIEFCLAETDPNGVQTTGIVRVVSPLTNFIMETQNNQVKALSFWPSTDYANIWIVNDICSQSSGCGVAGYATFPTSHGNATDGMVNEAAYFGSSPGNSSVQIHEMGHYLGLYHTFQGGCPNNDCTVQGDRVCDTPPDQSTAFIPCGNPAPNTCTTDDDDLSVNNPFRPVVNGGIGDQPDEILDYMDYGNIQCWSVFTQGQKDRMRGFLTTTRASLLNSNVCTPPCNSPYVASFTASQTTVNAGGTVNFTNTSTGGNTYNWTIDGVPFSTLANPNYTFNTLGTFTIILEVTDAADPNCLSTFLMNITVVCGAIADFTTPTLTVPTGSPVIFTNTSTNNTTNEWSVDNVVQATTVNFTHTFTTVGPHDVQLIVGNGLCTDTLIVQIEAVCPVIASFTASSSQVSPGDIVIFNNTSFGGNAFEWWIDGVLESTNPVSYTHTFNTLGNYTAFLIATDGVCIDTSAQIVITVANTGLAQTGLPVWPVTMNGNAQDVDWRDPVPVVNNIPNTNGITLASTGAGFNDCGALGFYVIHTGANAANNLFIYQPDGTPLLTTGTPNGPGLNGVRGGEIQVIPVPTIDNEWYIIYRIWSNDIGSPINNASYNPANWIFSRIRYDGISLAVIQRDIPLIDNGGVARTYTDGAAVSRTAGAIPDAHFLYLCRRTTGVNTISLDRFLLDATGITWSANTGTVPSNWWSLTCAGSPIELSPTEARVGVATRNQNTNYTDFVIFDAATFTAAAATVVSAGDLVMVPDGNPQDQSNVLNYSAMVSAVAADLTLPLRFLSNFERKLSRIEFSPNGRFLYITSGGFVGGSISNLTYLAQIDLDVTPFEVRMQIQQVPNNAHNPTTGGGCNFSNDPVCSAAYNGITYIESCYDGNLYFGKRGENILYVIPDPNNFMPQNLVPSNIDLATVQEPNIQMNPGTLGPFPDQIDGFNYLDQQKREVDILVTKLDCFGTCQAPYTVDLLVDSIVVESFVVTSCPDTLTLCIDTSLVYDLQELSSGYYFPGAIVGGVVNYPNNGQIFDFSGSNQGSPEICDNGYDDDCDGYVDCYDTECICNDSECSVDVVPDVLEAVLDWQSTINQASINASPMVANLNPSVDSLPEVIVAASPASITQIPVSQLLIFAGDGSNNAAPDILNVGSVDGYPMNHPAIADVNGDGNPEVAIVNFNRQIQVYSNYTPGANPPMTPYATSTGLTDSRDQNLQFADFDEDGIPEVYAGNDVFQFDLSNPGNPVLNKTLNGNGAAARLAWNNYGQPNTNSIAGDLLSVQDCGDPDCNGLEIAAGYHIYSVDLDPNDGDGVQIKIQRDLRTISGNNTWDDGYTAIVDLNLDGIMDVVVNGRFQGTYGMYVWDKNGLIQFFANPNLGNPQRGGGIPTISNVFDDRTTGAAVDYPEIVVCTDQRLNCFNLNAAIQNPATPYWWSLPTTDLSGVTGATSFDFNGDDIQEIVYRDQDNLRIMYGGPAPFPPGVDAQRNWFTFASGSGTFTEYPIVADVDNDRQAEIIYTTYTFQGTNTPPADYRGRLRVIQANFATGTWMSARQVWNQFGYYVTHVNDDLSIPAQQQNHTFEFPAGSGKRPFNKFLVQTPLLDENFEPYLPVPDAVMNLDTLICNGNNYEIVMTICNEGKNLLPAGTPITFYGSDPTSTNAPIVGSDVLPTDLAIDSCIRVVTIIPKPASAGVYPVINDDGSLPRPFDLSVDFPSTAIEECDYTNNMDGNPYDFPTPVLDLGPDVSVCQAGVYYFNAGSGFAYYEWQDGTIDSTYTAFAEGVYWVDVIDYCGNMYSDTVVVTMLTGALDILEDTTVCGVGTIINVSVPGVSNPNWTPTIGVDCPTCPTINITVTVDTTYVITAYDSTGCLVTDSFDINILNQANIGMDSLVICMGESVVIHGNPQTNPGNYSDTITIPGSCDSISIITLLVNDNPTISITSTATSCIACIGTADMTITGGTMPFTYAWSNGQTTEDLSNLCAGTYFVTVTDLNGCSNTSSVAVPSTNTFGVDFIGVNNQVTCNSGCDGSATVTATGGQTPFVYQWGDGQTTSIATGLCAGPLPVTVTDANGCKEVTGVVITQPTAVGLSISAGNDVSCNGLSDGSATATATGGVPPYTYQWGSGQTGPTPTSLDAGIHIVTVTDASGCETTESITINQPPLLTATATLDTDVSCNGLSDGGATATVTGGTIQYTYQWDNGETTPSATGLNAGTHSVTVTDDNGCTDIATVVIGEPDLLSATATLDTDVSCNGLSDGGATATATGGTIQYTYQWDNGETTPSATGLNAGTHSVTVTDDNGCTDIATVVIGEPDLLSATATLDTDVSCNGLSDGGATATATGGTVQYTYQWDNGETTPSATGLNAGTHSVTVTDDNGCTDIATVVIGEPDLLSATATLDTDVSCNGLSDGGATATATGGTIQYTYQWDNGETTPSATGLNAGTHFVTVTDDNSCTDIATVVIGEPDLLSAIATLDTDVSCNGLSDGGATATATGGNVQYTYQWDNGETTPSATGLNAGTHFVTVTDMNNCMSVTSVVISEPGALLIATTVLTNVSCNSLSDGSATVTITGGTPSFTFAWSNGEITSTATSLPAGTSTVTVTDGNGCNTIVSVLLTEPDILASSTTTLDVSCNSGSNGGATISPSGGTSPYFYLWSNGQLTQQLINVVAGSYDYTVTDSNGCTDTGSVTISEPTVMNGVLITTYSNCAGNIDLQVTGGVTPYAYNWSNGATTEDITGIPDGVYTVVVIDSNGCSWNGNATIQIASLPLSINAVGTNLTCNGNSTGSIDLTIFGSNTPYAIDWDNAPDVEDPTGLPAGTYTVTVLDSRGCAQTTSVTLLEPTVLTAVTSNSSLNCFGDTNGSITLAVNGGTSPYSFNWDNAPNVQNPFGLGAGTYNVIVTDFNGCTATATSVISQPTALTASLAQTIAGCAYNCDGTATYSVLGGTSPYSIAWSNGQSGQSANNLCAGNYTVSATDANGCVITQSFSIVSHPSISAVATVLQNVTCSGDSDGIAQVAVSGGVAPFTVIWSNGSAGTTASNLNGGTYTSTVTDANGCIATSTVFVSDPTPMTAVVAGTSTQCHNSLDGTGTVTAAGGIPPYSYLWDNGETNNPAILLDGGTHTVSITDANGCVLVESVVINSPPALVLGNASSTPPTCDGQANGSATIQGTGGTPPYIYTWEMGQNGPTIGGLDPGPVNVTITDANGCTFGPVSITIDDAPPALTATISSVDPLCFGSLDGSATVAPSGGTSSYTYLWNTGQTSQTAFGLGAGSYTVTITDGNGCQIAETVSLVQPPVIVASLMATDVICYGESNGSLHVLSSSGGTGMLDYSLDGVNFQADSVFNGIAAGMYTVYVRDDHGCVSEFVQYVAEPAELEVDAGLDVVLELGDSIQLDAMTNYNGPLTWNWETNEFLSCNDCPDPWVFPMNTITYQVMVLDTNGCAATDDITITVQIDRNVFIPNAYSPNGDGINDIFHVFGGPDVSNIKVMRLFDRWGEPVFEANNLQPNDPTLGWDGRFKGKEMDSAVFVYYVVVEFIDGYEQEYKGDVTLIR